MKNAIKKYWGNTTLLIKFFDFSKFLFIATLPLWRSVNTIAIWVLVLGWLLAVPNAEKLVNFKKNSSTFFVLGLLFLLMVFGVVLDLPQTENLKVIPKSLPLLIFGVIVLAADAKRYSIKQSIAFLCSGIFIGMIISYVFIVLNIFDRQSHLYLEQAEYFFEWIYMGWNLVKYIDIHPSYFAIMIVLATSSLIFDRDLSHFRKKRIPFLLLLLLFLLFLVETGSRIAIIALFFSLFVMVFVKFDIKKLLGAVAITIIGIIAILKFDYMHTKFIHALSGEERLYRWKEILNVFWEKGNLLIGIGEENAKQIYNAAYENGGFSLALKEQYNAHNQFLEFFVTTGLLGLLGYIFSFVFFVKKTKLKAISLFFFIAILCLSLTESFFDRSKGLVFFSFFYCLLIQHYQKRPNGK